MNSIVEIISHYNGILNGFVWGVPMLCLLFGVGVYPGMTDAKIEYMGKVIKESVNGR